MNIPDILYEICLERGRQDLKWGKMRDRAYRLPLPLMLTVLSEEVGEVASAILKAPIDGRDHIREELIQVAAVACAMLEALDLMPFGIERVDAG